MRRSKLGEAQIAFVLKQAEDGTSTGASVPAPSMISGKRSDPSAISTRPTNAETTSKPPDMGPIKRSMP